MVSRAEEIPQRVVDELGAAARAAREHAYVPASQFRVGAVVLAEDGRVFTGCNVENASYGLTVCAERVAVVTAVATGVRSVRAVAVAAEAREPAWPCGACCQVLAEFGPGMAVFLQGVDGQHLTTSLDRLLPHPFVVRR